MLKRATIFAIATGTTLGLAAPATANEQLAQKAGVEPGEYTTSEMLQIIDQPTALKRKQRIELIHKARADFAEAVQSALSTHVSSRSVQK